MLFFAFLVILTTLKDKYEKQIVKKYSQNKNFLGRTLFMPVIFFCFTILMMTRLTVFIYFMNLLFVIAFGYFFYEDLKIFLGFEPFPADLPIFASDLINGTSLKFNS